MTDKELLELAAKAAGIKGTWARTHQAYGDQWVDGLDCGGPFYWNPLVSDGDAMRLAMKLRLSIVHESERVAGEEIPTVEVIGPDRGDGSRHCEMNSLDDDPMAAVRRCITRAAASIGAKGDADA